MTAPKTPRARRQAQDVPHEAPAPPRRSPGRPPTGLPPRKTQLTTAVTAPEAQKIVAAAERADVTVSEWLRETALARIAAEES